MPHEPNVKDAENFIIYQKEGIYACFPYLMRSADGRLLTTFLTRTRVSHIDPAGGAATMVSADEGRTWTPADDDTPPAAHDAWNTPDGRWVRVRVPGWLYVSSDRRAELESRRCIVRDVHPGKIACMGGADCQTSRDGGRTWSASPIALPDDIAGLMPFHPYANELITPDGVRLACAYGRRKDRDLLEIFFFRSTDDGRNWSFIEMIPGGPRDAKVGFGEAAMIRLPNGDILAMCRPNPDQHTGHLHRSISKDQGLTWTRPQPTPIWGFPSDLLTLPDGRLLCIYGYRRPPMGIRACLSRDNGETWDIDRELILRSDGIGNPGDNGYPRVIQRSDGRLLTLYYINTDTTTPHIDGTIFSMPRT